MGLVRAILPTAVSVGAEAEWSTAITIGASAKISLTGELIVELLEFILDEAGVPA